MQNSVEFNDSQRRRLRSLYILMAFGVFLLTVGVCVACFARMYAHDSTHYDLFLWFGLLVAAAAAVSIVPAVACHFAVYRRAQRRRKDDIDATLPAAKWNRPQYQSQQPQYQSQQPQYQSQQQQQQQQASGFYDPNRQFSAAAAMGGFGTPSETSWSERGTFQRGNYPDYRG